MRAKTNQMDTRIPQNNRSQLPSRIVKAKLQKMTMGGGNATGQGIKKNENLAPGISKAIGKLPATAIQETMALTKPASSANMKQNASKPGTAAARQPLVTRSRTGIDLNNKPIGKAVPPRVAAAANNKKPMTNATTNEAKTPGATSKAPAAKRIPPYDYKARFLDLQEKHQTLKTKYEDAKEQLRTFDDLPEQFEQTKQNLQAAHDQIQTLNQLNADLTDERDSFEMKNDALVANVNDLEQRLNFLEEKCPRLENEVQRLSKENNELKTTNAVLVERHEKMTQDVQQYQEQLFKSNIERKELHNTVSVT